MPVQIRASMTVAQGAADPLKLDTGGTLSGTMAGNSYGVIPQTIATGSKQLLAIPASVVTPGWFFLKNLDPANYITLYPNNSGAPAMGIVPAGMTYGPVCLSGIPYAQATGGNVDIEFLIAEA